MTVDTEQHIYDHIFAYLMGNLAGAEGDWGGADSGGRLFQGLSDR